MSLNFDDKIHGEKTNYLCSSSESENENCIEIDDDSKDKIHVKHADRRSRHSVSVNTGPKGVLADYHQFLKIERQNKLRDEHNKIKLMKKLCLATNSENDEKHETTESDVDMESVLQEYTDLRRSQLKEQLAKNVKKFYKCFQLNSSNFVNEIDSESKHTNIIIHIYNKALPTCVKIHTYIKEMAEKFNYIKFAEISSYSAAVSDSFNDNALPAFLVYKNKQSIGIYLNVDEHLPDNFDISDLEDFLYNYLYSKKSIY
ncbi:hypothetical protein A3Q56_03490 [Intoshia linei]|uniref:Phosducin domain-containing protein n=1 Tax=Intoshia linei TaxID=1819745 RepID=A0A177B395_9BILA|nr:hypothetical protein A3Q56_03490 [Intoshia linei]